MTMAEERADYLDALEEHRGLMRLTVRGLTDEQASSHPTPSEVCLGGLFKHLAGMEQSWVNFVRNGPASMNSFFEEIDSQASEDKWLAEFQMQPGETLVQVLKDYDEAAARTDEFIATIPDFDVAQLLPDAPWAEKGSRWSARRVIVHIIAEIAQHAGHADIIREAIDGSKSTS